MGRVDDDERKTIKESITISLHVLIMYGARRIEGRGQKEHPILGVYDNNEIGQRQCCCSFAVCHGNFLAPITHHSCMIGRLGEQPSCGLPLLILLL